MAFADSELHNYGMLTSANSINISRWLSQQVYYALALAQWNSKLDPVISVPSGNFGNVCAGLVAQRSGLPVKQFIAACNTNDVFTRYLETGIYNPMGSVQTISNAMDVGDPSNFIRILELFNGDYELIKKHIASYSFSDEETAAIIANLYNKNHIMLDPHTAVAYAAMNTWQNEHQHDKGIILGTAHPLKFAPVVEKIINQKVAMPKKLAELMKKTKKSTLIQPTYSIAKQVIINILVNSN
jgi:threonine synthase